MITIEDIAIEVGCSVNTVSRALNNKPDVSAATRKKVLAAAKQLGYVPNTLAKSLVTKSSGSIGIVVPSLVNPLYARLVSAVEREAQQRQQTVLVGQSHDNPEQEKAAAEYLYQRRVDGLLIVPGSEACGHLESLYKALPMVNVLYETTHEDVPLPFAGCRLPEAVSTAIEHLASLGRKRLAVIGSSANTAITRSFYQGISMALADGNIDADIIGIRTGTEVGEGYYAALKLLQSNANIDGILLHNDILAPGVLAALKERGLDCPLDVAVIGCGNLEFADFLSVPLTSLDLFPERAGIEAVQLLGDMVQRADDVENVLPTETILSAQLIVRRSSNPVYVRKACREKAESYSVSLLNPAYED